MDGRIFWGTDDCTVVCNETVDEALSDFIDDLCEPITPDMAPVVLHEYKSKLLDLSGLKVSLIEAAMDWFETHHGPIELDEYNLEDPLGFDIGCMVDDLRERLDDFELIPTGKTVTTDLYEWCKRYSPDDLEEE